MRVRRREFLAASGAAVWSLQGLAMGADPVGPQLIIDTHQHLWVRDRVDPPWVAKAAGILRLSYGPDEYREATRGTEIHGLDREMLLKAMQVLAKRGKAQVFGQEDSLGVKFF